MATKGSSHDRFRGNLDETSVGAGAPYVSKAQRGLGCANQDIRLEQTKTGTTVRGSVRLGNFDPFEGVLVEVVRQPKKGAPSYGNMERTGTPQGKRVAACIVGKDGEFLFHLSPGKYELRFRRSSEWNCTFLKIEVVEGLRTEKLEVPMHIGT